MAVVKKKAQLRLDVRVSAGVHPHDALLKEQRHLQGRLSREETLVRRTPPGVGLGRRYGKAVRNPDNTLQPQAVTVGPQCWGSPQVDAWKHQPDLATGRMTAFNVSPDGAFEICVLLRPTQGRVFTANPRGVAKLHVVAAGKFSTVVRTEALRPPHVVHVGDERPHVYKVVFDFFLILYGRIHV